jgi:hypothetical protein
MNYNENKSSAHDRKADISNEEKERVCLPSAICVGRSASLCSEPFPSRSSVILIQGVPEMCGQVLGMSCTTKTEKNVQNIYVRKHLICDL